MFNLEYQLGKWRAEMAATGLAVEILDELETHLRDDFEQQVRDGTEPAEAFAAALRRLGPPRELSAEFGRSGSASMACALRRHRWKVWLCAGVCLLVEIVLNVFRPQVYVSEATLLVQPLATQVAASASTETEAKRVANLERASRILQSEVDVLRSFDLAKNVAIGIRPEIVLRLVGGGKDPNGAAATLQRGIYADTSPQSGVIRLSLRHVDADLVQPVLREWLQVYAEKHRAVHMRTDNPAGAMTIVVQQAPTAPRADFFWGERLSGLARLTLAGFLTGLVWMLVAGTIDVYLGSLGLVVRRHKWKFVLCAGVGLATAETIYALRPVVYRSETKLYVRYFVREAGVLVGDANWREPPAGGVAIMDREMDRLTNIELLRQTALQIGPERILKKAGGGQDPERATTVIQRGLIVQVIPRSSVISVSFQHPDANLVPPILNELTSLYLEQHASANRIEVGAADPAGKVSNISMIQLPPPAFRDKVKAKSIFVQVVLAGIMAGLAWMVAAGVMDRRAKLAR